MNEITPKEYFYLNDGRALKNIKDLEDELKKNCESQNLENFNHHVTAQRNDYANWIEGVFQEVELAEKIRTKKTPKEMLDEINKHYNKIKEEKKEIKTEKQEQAENKKTKKKRERAKEYIKKIFKIKKQRKTYEEDEEELNDFDVDHELENEIKEIKKEINENITRKNFLQAVKKYRELKRIFLAHPEEKYLKKELYTFYIEIKKVQEIVQNTKDAKLTETKQETNLENAEDAKDEPIKQDEKTSEPELTETENKQESNLENAEDAKEDTKIGDETQEEFTERISDSAEKLLERTKNMKQNQYINTEKQKESTTSLREKYEELNAQISENRRKGTDMFIPYMHLRLIKPKLHFLEISNNNEDRERISQLLKEVEEDIKDAIEKKEPDLKTDILKSAGLYEEKNDE